MNATVKALNNEEAAALLGITPGSLRIWRCKGKGPKFTKLGEAKQAGVVYYEADVLAWIEERKFSSTSAYSPAALANAKSHNSQSSDAAT
jgi:predicted DNA-binding transcriptional regulator AlpA